MTDRKNLKLRASLYRRLKDDKGRHVSWPDYLKSKCLDDDIELPEDTDDDANDEINTDALNELLDAAHTIEDRTGRIESTLDDLQR